MKVLILAAGRGTRISRYLSGKPKCTVDIGGGTKDGFLCQMTADSLNMDVIAGPTEATALGNIVLQLIALGDIKNVDEGREIIKSSEKLTTYKSENAGAFANNYNKFVKILNK